jgi:hypothetical protein
MADHIFSGSIFECKIGVLVPIFFKTLDTALATAAIMGTTPVSPRPLAPNGV